MDTAAKNPWHIFYMKAVITASLAVALSIFFLLTGVYGWLNVFHASPSSWFQTSGAAMLVALVISECQVRKIQNDINNSQMTPSYAIKTQDSFRVSIKILTWLTHCLTMLALVIGGAGSAIYSFITLP